MRKFKICNCIKFFHESGLVFPKPTIGIVKTNFQIVKKCRDSNAIFCKWVNKAIKFLRIYCAPCSDLSSDTNRFGYYWGCSAHINIPDNKSNCYYPCIFRRKNNDPRPSRTRIYIVRLILLCTQKIISGYTEFNTYFPARKSIASSKLSRMAQATKKNPTFFGVENQVKEKKRSATKENK